LKNQQAFENECVHELCILYIGQFLALTLLVARNLVTCPHDWFYLQLNGLVHSHYYSFLSPVKNYLHGMPLSILQELLASLVRHTNFLNSSAAGCTACVITLDEINILVHTQKAFLSIISKLPERPLIILVLRVTYNHAGLKLLCLVPLMFKTTLIISNHCSQNQCKNGYA
jgi:hypothetical protein